MIYAFLFALLTGYSAFAYSSSIGENIHLSETLGQWQNYAFLEKLLTGMHIHSVRSSLRIAGDDGHVQFLNELAAAGITSDELVDTSFTSWGEVATALQPLPGVAWLEGPNEQDISGDPDWIAHDQAVASLLAVFRSCGLGIIAPSVTFADPAELGDFSSSVTYANAHPYTGRRMPETLGWGPPIYGEPYGSIEYNIAQARRVGATLPVVATEEGYSSAEVDELTQASYVERETLWAFAHGINHQWLYDLLDDSQAFGVARTDGSLKPVAQGLAGLLQLTADSGIASAPCTLGVSIATSLPYESLTLCKTDGEKDLILWEPAQLEDPDTGRPEPATESLVMISAPRTTGRTVIYEQSPEYLWSGRVAANPRNASATLSERPLVIVYHAKGVATFPKLPSLGTGTGIIPGGITVPPGS